MIKADPQREELPELLRAWSEVDAEAGRIERSRDMIAAAEEIERLRRIVNEKTRPLTGFETSRLRAARLPDVLPWQRADLFAWGETIRTGSEYWRRTWDFGDAWLSEDNVDQEMFWTFQNTRRSNAYFFPKYRLDGLVYRISDPDGTKIYEGVSEEDGDRTVRHAIISRYPEVFGEAGNTPTP